MELVSGEGRQVQPVADPERGWTPERRIAFWTGWKVAVIAGRQTKAGPELARALAALVDAQASQGDLAVAMADARDVLRRCERG